jgi:carboxylate-amine ligase
MPPAPLRRSGARRQEKSEAQQMREFVANGGSLIGLVQKHCEIWAA